VRKYGVGTSVPSKGYKSGTKVPLPEEMENGAGVLTPSNGVKTLVSSDNDNGTNVPAPEKNPNGTEVPAPAKNLNRTEAPPDDGAEVPSPRRFLPHIDMIGYYQFVTFRTYESLDDFIKKIRSEKISSSLREYKIDQYIDHSPKGRYLNDEVLDYLYNYFLDKDKELYELIAFSIMPNHVHMLFKQNTELSKTMKQIKGATAFGINKIMHRKGIFWEENYYDRVIRDEMHFSQVYDYIAYNAAKVGLDDARERFYGIYE